MACKGVKEDPLANLVDRVADRLGPGPHRNFNVFITSVAKDAKKYGVKLTNKRKKLLRDTLAERSEEAEPVLNKVHRSGPAEPDPLHGLFAGTVAGRPCVVEYEPDSKLRDTEKVPLTEDSGIEAFLRREVLPYAPDAWYEQDSVKVGYEIGFTCYFYKPKPMRTLEEIQTDILQPEKETEGLLTEILGLGGRP